MAAFSEKNNVDFTKESIDIMHEIHETCSKFIVNFKWSCQFYPKEKEAFKTWGLQKNTQFLEFCKSQTEILGKERIWVYLWANKGVTHKSPTIFYLHCCSLIYCISRLLSL